VGLKPKKEADFSIYGNVRQSPVCGLQVDAIASYAYEYDCPPRVFNNEASNTPEIFFEQL
jgi:hypothetical protein